MSIKQSNNPSTSRRQFLTSAGSAGATAVVATSFATQAIANPVSRSESNNSAWLEQLGQRIGLQAWNEVVPTGSSHPVSLQFHAASEQAGNALLVGLSNALQFAQRSSGLDFGAQSIQSNFSAQPHLLASAIVTNDLTGQSVLVEISAVALSYEQWAHQEYALTPSSGVYWMGRQ